MSKAFLAVLGLAASLPGFAATGFSSAYSVTAVAGIKHAFKLATSDTVTPTSATISWGDTQTSDGFVAQPCVYCDLWGVHQYQTAGKYQVVVTYNTGCCVRYSVTTTATVRAIAPSDFVIVSVGDSVASGEGNPIVNSWYTNPSLWEDGTGAGTLNAQDVSHCHVSPTAGGSRAAALLQYQNLKTNIVFLNLACTGARVSDAATQIGNAKALLATVNHPINALLITAGANDLGGGFGTIVNTCLSELNCSTDTTLINNITYGTTGSDGGLFDLLGWYTGNLLNAVNSVSPNNVVTEETYIAEYHDPTHDENGQFPNSNISNFCLIDLISEPEWSFLYWNVVSPLQSKVDAAATANNWHLVPVTAGFLDHGYCAKNEQWVINAPQSIVQQADVNGTGHPNPTGHGYIGQQMATQIQEHTKPTSSLIVSPQPMGEWSRVPMSMTLSAVNKLPSAGVGGIFYRLDGQCTAALPGSLYSASVALSTEGVYNICYVSRNNYGDFETTIHTRTVGYDRTPPVTTGTVSKATLSLSATDNLSQVKNTYYKLDRSGTVALTGCTQKAPCTVKLTTGKHVIYYYSIDNAGNQETEHLLTVTI